MRDELEQADITFDFFAEEEVAEEKNLGYYKVIIADDDVEIHNVTRMILKNFEFEGRTLMLLDAYSGKEAKRNVGAASRYGFDFLRRGDGKE